MIHFKMEIFGNSLRLQGPFLWRILRSHLLELILATSNPIQLEDPEFQSRLRVMDIDEVGWL